MHIHDWSIKKKLLLSHFLMIGIPVLIVMVVILGILFSFLLATGSQKPTVLPGNDNASVSGYVLQLTVDSLTEQVAPKLLKILTGVIYPLQFLGQCLSQR